MCVSWCDCPLRHEPVSQKKKIRTRIDGTSHVIYIYIKKLQKTGHEQNMNVPS